VNEPGENYVQLLNFPHPAQHFPATKKAPLSRVGPFHAFS
jgi:hypothetical protein